MKIQHSNRLFIFFALFILGCASRNPTLPAGDYLGLLRFPNITYRLYINSTNKEFVLMNATFKAGRFSLDTIYFKNDSLYFKIGDYYSEYKGHYDRTSHRITGQWTAEDTSAYILEFVPINADTLSGLHPRTSVYSYKAPAQVADGILTNSLASQHITKAPLDKLMQRIIRGRYADIHSILIARHDSLVLEEYFYRFDQNYIYNIQSATKSIVSALTGIAIARNEIKSVQETLCASLPPYKELACNDQNKEITLQQLLTMSTGIPWDEQKYDYMDARNSAAIAANEKDQFIYLLSLPRVKSASPVFAYNSLNHTLMNAVLRNATKLENKQELTDRLLKPLGIENSYIGEPTPMGAIGDIDLRPRDMLKFGLLYIHEGRWNQQQLVPAQWVRESTTPKIHPTSTLGYGYFWWTRNFRWKEKTVASFFAWGYGGQYIIVIPEVDLVIVMSGSHWGTNPESQMVDIVEEILSAVEP